MHKLAFIAITGLVGSAACIGAAAAIGGRDFSDGLEGFSLFDGRPHCEAIAGASATSRDMDWNDGDHIGLNLLGHASYTPGSGDRLHASGDPQLLAHLRIRHGTVELDCRGWRSRTKELALTLPGRIFTKFDVMGANLTIDKLDQDRVSLTIAGSGKLQANGKLTDNVRMTIAGSGEMNLGQISAAKGKMEIAGSGTMRSESLDIGDLKMEIAGSGRNEIGQLISRTVKSSIAGSGTVIAKGGSADDVSIEIAGSGRTDFGGVTARNARVEIGGHGDVDIAPTDFAKVDIGGSGDVNLHSNPKELKTDIGGSGRIHRLGPAT
jgi:hypothetical protein